MTPRPMLTIVIPTHTARGFLPVALDSAARALRPHDELLVVANGCTSAYLRELRTMVRAPARLIVREQAGVAHARNAGLQEAQGSVVLFLDDDDVLIDGGVAALRDALHYHPAWIGVAGAITKFDESGEHRGESYRIDGEILSPLRLLRQSITTPGAVLLRTGALRQLGGFDPASEPAEDFELWLRMAATAPLAGIPTPVLRYRVHPGAVSGNVPRMAARALAIFRLHARAYAEPRYAATLRRAAAQMAWYYRGRLRSALRAQLRAGNWRGAWSCLMLLAQFQRLITSYDACSALWQLWGRPRGEPVGEADPLAFPYLAHSTSNDTVNA